MAAATLLTAPGFLTGETASGGGVPASELRSYVARGYRWVAYQVQNGEIVRDVDLAPAKSAGLFAGVYGVSYGLNHKPDAAAFFRDGKLLGIQASKLGAEHVQGDIEYAAKGTLRNRGLQAYIDGIRAGGWMGPVHLNTLGASARPLEWNFEIDHLSILATGGGILAQGYFNAFPDYRPVAVYRYWTEQVKIPPDKLSILIAFYNGASENPNYGREINGSEWVSLLLEAAGRRKAWGIWNPEQGSPSDLNELDVLSEAPMNDAERIASIAEIAAPLGALPRRQAMSAVASQDAAVGTPTARMACIREIAEAKDPVWLAPPKGKGSGGERVAAAIAEAKGLAVS